MSIKKVLIANRGEIALRVQRACDKLAIASTVTVSEPDSKLYFARAAHEVAVIGPGPAKESYLNIPNILAAAKKNNCDAVHPGYGFLSERAEFARAVIEAGLIWIGPPPSAIEAIGSKTAAREIARRIGVPTTPGSPPGLNDNQLAELAQEVGFPVLIKAVAGGGGRGMRVVESRAQMLELAPRARSEALKNFGSEEIYFEKLIVRPRHVEVQIMADSLGNILHLGTRDCSTQRRHQKLVEEAPAPFLDSELREEIHNAAVKVAAAVGYQNAGTAEFLVSGSDFYFLEMNTRLQVEHPVTEEVTGLDLVELQLRVARGEALPLSQEQVKFNGHAIEYRIYAEDPADNFSPTRGTIQAFIHPDGKHIREDYGFEQGDELSLFYDGMLSKLIVTGNNRSLAIQNSEAALSAIKIQGPATTIPFHRWLLKFTQFRSAPLDITFIERNYRAAESIRELKASDILDSKHRAPLAGAVYCEHFCYTSRRFKESYRIEVIHEPGGTFLLTPINSSGMRARPRHCRRSNGLDCGIKAVIEQVLEKEFPAAVVEAF